VSPRAQTAGRPTPATAKGERRRAEILAAALALFADQGYDATSIGQIADRAGAPKSVIYDHFASKVDLHSALLESEAATLLAHVASAVPPEGKDSHAERLDAGIDAFFSYVEEHPAAWKLLVRDAPADPDLADAHAIIQRRATEVIAFLICPEEPRGRARRREREMLAEALKSSIVGLAQWWYDHPKVPRRELVELVHRFAWPALCAFNQQADG
jgi:AcrR family transcriptional regulator